MNRKMECTYSVVPDHIAQSVTLSDNAFRLIVWMLSKKNKDRIADFSYLKLQADKENSILELINKNYLIQDDAGLYINHDIMFEDFSEQQATSTSVDSGLAYFQQVFDLVSEYSQKRLNFNNAKFRVRCDEFLREGYTIEHIKALCIQLSSQNSYFDWYELESTALAHIKNVMTVHQINNQSTVKPNIQTKPENHSPFYTSVGQNAGRQIQNQSSFMASYHQIRQDPQKMNDIKQVYDHWFKSKKLPSTQYIAPKPTHYEKLHSLLSLHSIQELKRAVDGTEYRRDIINKGRNFNDIFTNSAHIDSLVSLAASMDVSQQDTAELRVFNYWLERTQAASGFALRMTASQRDLLSERLKVFTEADLLQAVDGAQEDNYYRTVNFAFGLLFKDDAQVMNLVSLARNGKQTASVATRKDSNVNKALADMGISKFSVGNENNTVPSIEQSSGQVVSAPSLENNSKK